MLTLVYNFTNATDEAMTQVELMKSPEGQSFIEKWTWKNQECVCGKPRFRKSNTVEDYFYVRVIERDMLLGIGAIRIHWNKDGDFIFDTNMEIVRCGKNYHWCEDPNTKYDIHCIIKDKLYTYLTKKITGGRYCDRNTGCCCSDHVHYDHGCQYPPDNVPGCKPPHKPDCNPPYYRYWDDRGLQYKNHNYRPKPGEMEPNPPKNGPYGGMYNVYDEVK